MTEEKITLSADPAYPLKGCLTLPDSTETKCPAVVFVHGSGSSNMDEKVFKLTPFRDLAHGLASHGIASLRYDKRSYAHGFKMIRDKHTPLTVKEETVDDAVAAAEFLRADARIDADRVFIVGHSMGGMLAPRIDAAGGNFRGLVIMAGTPRRLDTVLREQCAAQQETAPAFLRGFVRRQMDKILAPFDDLDTMTDEEAMKKKFGGGTTLYYFRELANHPDSEALDACRKPMLIMQGSRDAQVSTERDYALYRELLADRDNVEFRLYDGLNHVFVPSIYGTIDKLKKEYSVEQHIGADVIADIAEFVHRY